MPKGPTKVGRSRLACIPSFPFCFQGYEVEVHSGADPRFRDELVRGSS